MEFSFTDKRRFAKVRLLKDVWECLSLIFWKLSYFSILTRYPVWLSSCFYSQLLYLQYLSLALMLSWSLWQKMNLLHLWLRRKLQLSLCCLIRLVQLPHCKTFELDVETYYLFVELLYRWCYLCVICCLIKEASDSAMILAMSLKLTLHLANVKELFWLLSCFFKILILPFV